jgi:lipopolysaccharide export system protein LptA
VKIPEIRLFTLLFFVVTAAFPLTAFAQDADVRLPIMLDADETDYDGRNSMLMFRGLRLSQGNLGIQADQGRASQLDFEDSVWQFAGNVVIEIENGRIECDSADLKFSGHLLELATIAGSPATFEMLRPGSDVATYAEAGRLKYDFDAGIIEFSDQAIITEGGNQISSNYLVYNIKEQRINAQSADEGGERVKITYTPRDSADNPDDSATPDALVVPDIVPDDERDDDQ